MSWVERISEPPVLRRCIHDLISLSSLPPLWRDCDSEQIADSVATALLPMLDADLIFVSVAAPAEDPPIEVLRTREALPPERSESARELLRGARDSWNGGFGAGRNLFGEKALQIVAAPIGKGRESIIAAASTSPDFPTETHRLLLGIAANYTSTAVQHWTIDSQQRRLIALIECSSEFIGFSDLRGRPQYVNAAAREVLGFSVLDEMQDATIFDLMAEDERLRARTKLMPLVLKTGRWTGELKLRHRVTGESIPFFIDWFRIDDALTGRPMNMAAVGRDLRAEKHHELALSALTQSLEQKVAERTGDLTRAISRLRFEAAERLRADARAQELQLELFHASRLSAAGQMAGALAHELSQPLTAFTNSVNAARRMLGDRGRHEGDNIRAVLSEAGDEALRAGEIVRGLRQFVTRGETGLRLEHLPSLIQQASGLAMTDSSRSGVQVLHRFDPRAETVLGNRIQLQQVIFNLVRNAIEAGSKCDQLQVEVATRLLDDGCTEITVADRGPGVPEEISKNLFEPFRTTKPEGMGLGLSICRTIAEAHGGRLECERNSEHGSIFRLTLPVQPGESNGD